MPVRIETAGSTATIQALGRRLRAIRAIGGLTQEEVCDVAGIDQSTYSKWEKGKRMPDALVLMILAARFRTSLDFLFRGAPIGTHPELLQLMRWKHPDLVADMPSRTDQDTDTVLSSYRAAIALDGSR